MKKKIIRISTVPESLETFCKGQLKWLSINYNIVAVSSPLPELNIIKEREMVKTIAVNMERHISLAKDLKSLLKMIWVFYKEKPTIVHSMTPKAGLVSMLAAWICRVPIRMHTYTGLVFPTTTGFKQKVLIYMDKLLCFCATYINPEGRGVANDLYNFKITNKPLHIIGNGNVRGIDLDYWNPILYQNINANNENRNRLGIKSYDFVYLYVGRIVADKGINELVHAFKLLKVPNVKLLLVGSYEEKLDPLRKETYNEIENNNSIIVVGKKKDVRPYYALSNAFVLPSYREGFPNVVLEAGAMGLPSIVTDINGSNEIIKNNENGVIVPTHNYMQLMQNMESFYRNKQECKQMGIRSREIVSERFEQKYIWNELLKTYKSLIYAK